MKIIYNNVIPFKGFIAINICGLLFVRNEYKGQIDDELINHEEIHTAQMKELLYIFFYIIYLLEWIYRLIVSSKSAYFSISFEKEAYDNQDNLDYLKTRKHYSQWR